jgi:hypothetical protein
LRKKKFAKDKSVFMVINNSQTHAMYVGAEDVLNSPVVENKNERGHLVRSSIAFRSINASTSICWL